MEKTVKVKGVGELPAVFPAELKEGDKFYHLKQFEPVLVAEVLSEPVNNGKSVKVEVSLSGLGGKKVSEEHLTIQKRKYIAFVKEEEKKVENFLVPDFKAIVEKQDKLLLGSLGTKAVYEQTLADFLNLFEEDQELNLDLLYLEDFGVSFAANGEVHRGWIYAFPFKETKEKWAVFFTRLRTRDGKSYTSLEHEIASETIELAEAISWANGEGRLYEDPEEMFEGMLLSYNAIVSTIDSIGTCRMEQALELKEFSNTLKQNKKFQIGVSKGNKVVALAAPEDDPEGDLKVLFGKIVKYSSNQDIQIDVPNQGDIDHAIRYQITKGDIVACW